MQYFHGTKIDFISKRNLFFTVSAIILSAGLILTIVLGPVLGIDFTGGTEIAKKFSGNVNTEQIRNAVENAGITGSEIKSFGKDNQYLIRIKGDEAEAKIIDQTLASAFPGMEIETLKVDSIGAKIGSELYTEALIAVMLAMLAILIYIAFRFEFIFGLGAIAALVHDVFLTFFVIVIVHHTGIIDLEINQTILAGLLTVLGYSINDTVIIFDRIRENREVHKTYSIVNRVNLSINETLTRTVNTVATTFLVLATLVLFGGPVLQGFAFTMLIGIITGTYSSIYIASSFVVWYSEKVKKIDVERAGKTMKSKVKA